MRAAHAHTSRMQVQPSGDNSRKYTCCQRGCNTRNHFEKREQHSNPASFSGFFVLNMRAHSGVRMFFVLHILIAIATQLNNSLTKDSVRFY